MSSAEESEGSEAPIAHRPLTERQQRVLDFICLYKASHDRPPSLREIGTHMGIRSTNGVSDHLRALERKGYLLRDGMKARGIRVTRRDPKPIQAPELLAPYLDQLTRQQRLLSRAVDAIRTSPKFTAPMASLLGDILSELGRADQ